MLFGSYVENRAEFIMKLFSGYIQTAYGTTAKQTIIG